MSFVAPGLNTLQTALQQVFTLNGPLQQTLPGYRVRDGQVMMAQAVAQAIDDTEVLVVEAGTGVGKTFAYLVPALLSGKRVLVSTATKALQDQLFTRDLPRLTAALSLPLRARQLKGRSAYLCRERLQQARQGRLGALDPQVLRNLADIERWSQQTVSGDLSELPQLDESDSLLALVSSTRDNCMGQSCPHWSQCHVNQAREQALQADVLVINHHVLFADWEVQASGVSQLLPEAGVVIIDEAHQLNPTGLQFAGTRLSSRRLQSFARDCLRQGQQAARGMADWLVLGANLEQALRYLRLAAGTHAPGTRLAWQQATPEQLDAAAWRQALRTVALALKALLLALQPVHESDPSLRQLLLRGSELWRQLGDFAQPAADDCVRWLELEAQHWRMLRSPLTIAALLAQHMQRPEPASTEMARPPTAWVFTSATLGQDRSLTWFTQTCGLVAARCLQLPSPFDYAKQAALYIPDDAQEPGTLAHSLKVAELAWEGAQTLGGRTLILTTSNKALKAIGQHLEQRRGLFSQMQVLVQGQAPKRALLERFTALGTDGDTGAMLVATASFWEGIDLPGDLLQLLIIDKLPFPPPDDLLVQARSRQLASLGGNPFEELMLPEAAMALKQGAGRLIRSETDQGVLVICDPRLHRKSYGRNLLACVPDMRVLHSRQALMQELENLTRQRLTRASTKSSSSH